MTPAISMAPLRRPKLVTMANARASRAPTGALVLALSILCFAALSMRGELAAKASISHRRDFCVGDSCLFGTAQGKKPIVKCMADTCACGHVTLLLIQVLTPVLAPAARTC